MEIIGHRGNLLGPDPAQENTLGAIKQTVAYHFAVEIDVQYDEQAQQGYLSHDPSSATADNDLLTCLQLMEDALAYGQHHPAHAWNVKTAAGLTSFLKLLPQFPRVATNGFLFDYELAFPDSTERTDYWQRSQQQMQVAARLSETESSAEEIVAQGHRIVWADEWEQPWITRQSMGLLHHADIRVYAVSPELHRPMAYPDVWPAWSRFREAGVHGICTDYPLQLRKWLGQ